MHNMTMFNIGCTRLLNVSVSRVRYTCDTCVDSTCPSRASIIHIFRCPWSVYPVKLTRALHVRIDHHQNRLHSYRYGRACPLHPSISRAHHTQRPFNWQCNGRGGCSYCLPFSCAMTALASHEPDPLKCNEDWMHERSSTTFVTGWATFS